MSCSRLSIQHRCALRPLPRWQARKMMQSWLHRHRSTTHNPRHLPAPSLQPAQRPLMASRLIARCNPGSFSLFTECLHLLTTRSTPEEVVKYYTWTSDQPRLYLKQSPTTTTLMSLVKWANHPSRLNGNKSLDSMATQLLRQRMPKGDAPTLGAMAASWGLEPGYLTKLTEKALSHLIVTARLLS